MPVTSVRTVALGSTSRYASTDKPGMRRLKKSATARRTSGAHNSTGGVLTPANERAAPLR